MNGACDSPSSRSQQRWDGVSTPPGGPPGDELAATSVHLPPGTGQAGCYEGGERTIDAVASIAERSQVLLAQRKLQLDRLRDEHGASQPCVGRRGHDAPWPDHASGLGLGHSPSSSSRATALRRTATAEWQQQPQQQAQTHHPQHYHHLTQPRRSSPRRASSVSAVSTADPADLHTRGMQQLERRAQRQRVHAEQLRDRESRSCPFRPDLSRTHPCADLGDCPARDAACNSLGEESLTPRSLSPAPDERRVTPDRAVEFYQHQVAWKEARLEEHGRLRREKLERALMEEEAARQSSVRSTPRSSKQQRMGTYDKQLLWMKQRDFELEMARQAQFVEMTTASWARQPTPRRTRAARQQPQQPQQQPWQRLPLPRSSTPPTRYSRSAGRSFSQALAGSDDPSPVSPQQSPRSTPDSSPRRPSRSPSRRVGSPPPPPQPGQAPGHLESPSLSRSSSSSILRHIQARRQLAGSQGLRSGSSSRPAPGVAAAPARSGVRSASVGHASTSTSQDSLSARKRYAVWRGSQQQQPELQQQQQHQLHVGSLLARSAVRSCAKAFDQRGGTPGSLDSMAAAAPDMDATAKFGECL